MGIEGEEATPLNNRFEVQRCYPRPDSVQSEVSESSQSLAAKRRQQPQQHSEQRQHHHHHHHKQTHEPQSSTRTDRTHGGLRTSAATRCLHVGNVPASLSEQQLQREFEKFGQIDGLKVISQKNGSRRFAFITFRTVDQAATARNCMSKLHPWKSAISFAHKEYSHSAPIISNGNANGSVRSGIARNQYYTYAEQPENRPFAASNFNGRGTLPRPVPVDGHSHLSHSKDQVWPQHPATTPSAGTWPIDSTMPSGSAGLATLPSAACNNSSHLITQQTSANPDCPILRRLCDDCWVPTQPWPTDQLSDSFYCDAIIQQLHQFGGCTTISKLRGFLRNRISAVDNIKSVPLKALISAYSHLFSLEGNYVSLRSNVGVNSSISSSHCGTGTFSTGVAHMRDTGAPYSHTR